MNNFFRQELIRLFGDGKIIRQPKFVGRVCLGNLDSQLKVRVEFVCGRYTDYYDALELAVINRIYGLVDKLILFFEDILEGENRVSNFNFPRGKPPYIWVDKLRAEWYAVKPTEAVYAAIRAAAADYLSIYRAEKEFCV